jgi:hypothetical protein
MSAIESFLISLLFIRIIYRSGIGGFFKNITSSPFILFCFLFSFIFGIGVGLSSYNFGALVRYKIPCMSIFVIGLYLVEHQVAQNKILHLKKKK